MTKLSVVVFALFLTSAIDFSCCDHLVVGNVANRVMYANHTRVQYNAVPFIKRVKYFFYAGPNSKPIQGIQALDLIHSRASINITAGGLGYPYVNLRLKSERGMGLDYDIGIYVQPDYL